VKYLGKWLAFGRKTTVLVPVFLNIGTVESVVLLRGCILSNFTSHEESQLVLFMPSCMQRKFQRSVVCPRTEALPSAMQ
jgi:hypothetical protein